MKFATFLGILILGLLFCTPGENVSKLNISQSCHGKVVCIEQWKNEVFNLDSIMIDSIIAIISNKNQLLLHFGIPEKKIFITSRNQISDYLDSTYAIKKERIYFKNISFDVIGEFAVLHSVNFENSDIKLISKQLTMTSHTLMPDICEIFPESCNLTVMPGFHSNGSLQLFSSSKFHHMRWFVHIKNGNVARIQLVDTRWPS
ncbi:MAG: hypothetical protein ACOYNO_09765 [Saprospiraceae bacterium]